MAEMKETASNGLRQMLRGAAYCLFVPLLILPIQTQEDKTLTEHFRAGQAAAANRQFEKAISEFRVVLQMDPSLVQARANLGLMYYLFGHYDQAAVELLRVTRTDPSLISGHLFLGLSYLKLGKLDQAVPPLQKTKELDPSNVEARRGLLACYMNLGKFSEATNELHFFERQPGEEALYVIGQAYLDMGRTLTSRMGQKYPSSAWAHRLAGDLAADRGDWTTAADEFRKSLAADSGIPGVQHSLDTALARTQAANSDSVSSLTSNDAELDPDSLATNETPQVLYQLIRGCTARGEAYFKKLQDSFPDSPYAHELRGDVYRLRQDFPAALVEFQAALKNLTDDAALHRSAAEMDILLEHLDDAEAELDRAAKLNPDNPDTEYLLGQAYAKENQTDKAVQHLRAAVLRDPNLLQARALLGTAYMHLNKPALAIPELQKAAPLDYYGDLHFQLYKAYRAVGDAASAAKVLAISNEMRKKSLTSAVAKISGTSPAELDGDTSKQPGSQQRP